MTEVHLDWETASEAPITGTKSVGTHRYAEDPSTHILCLGYSVDGGPKRLWLPSWPFPAALREAAKQGATFVAYSEAFEAEQCATFVAHNAAFEKAIWRHVLHRHGVRIPVPQKWRCTLAACAYRGLPQGLGKVGDVLNLPIQKSPRGAYLIQRLCKRHKPSKKWPTGWIRPEAAGPGPKTDPDRYRREAANLLRELYKYCLTDVEAEEILDQTLGPLPESEQLVWTLDQAINERGVRVDMETVRCGQNVVDAVERELTAELQQITCGAVMSHNQTAKIVGFVNHDKNFIDDLKADTVKEALANPDTQMPGYAIRVLEIRQELGKSSLKKLAKLKATVMSDGKCRGMLQYHGAGTGRWAGRGAQPHNLPKPENEDLSQALLIALIKTKDLRDIRDGYGGNPLLCVADGIRGMFMADDDSDLIASDYSSIEARILAWVAGEEWKLKMFERGENPYCVTAAKILKVESVSKKDNPKEYGIGKVCELAGGYQGWIGAWRGFDKSDKYTDAEVAEFMGQWRDEHPATRRLWRMMEKGAGQCVYTGKPQKVANIWFQMVSDLAGEWLTIVLPNGRRIWYYEPGFTIEDTPHGPEINVTYQGRDNKRGGSWGIIHPYGGMWTENIVQAIARDILVAAMIRVEYAGYPIVLTVHDEIVAQILKLFGSLEEFNALLCIKSDWMHGLPIEVSGWRGRRFRK